MMFIPLWLWALYFLVSFAITAAYVAIPWRLRRTVRVKGEGTLGRHDSLLFEWFILSCAIGHAVAPITMAGMAYTAAQAMPGMMIDPLAYWTIKALMGVHVVSHAITAVISLAAARFLDLKPLANGGEGGRA